MATLHVVLARVVSRADTGMTLPVLESVEVDAETVTPTGTSTLSSLTASDKDVWNITAFGGDYWLKFGTGTPEAESGAGYLILSGQTRDFAASTDSEKLAHKTAT